MAESLPAFGTLMPGAEAIHPIKLKLVERQMYGRGKIDLLQARVIGLA